MLTPLIAVWLRGIGQMLKFVGRHWRGEGSFWVAVLVYSLIVAPVLIFGLMSWLGAATVEQTPWASIYSALAVFSAVAIIGIWQFVGTWRASSADRAPDRWRLTRWAGRAVALASLGLALFAVSTAPSGIARYYADATDADPIGQQPHDVEIDGDQIVVTGLMSWGLFYQFRDALAGNPQVQRAVLNSPGGHYGVGRLMERLISERGLDTSTTTMCGSACTYAFLGGKNRVLGRGARLGFHAPFGNTEFVLKNITQHATGVLQKAGVPDPFIARIFATPGESVWYPTPNELRQANIITEVE